MITKHIHITGIVQGVGFRPFIYQLAHRIDLRGTVSNTSAGVDIFVSGSESKIEEFIQRISEEAPPLSQITQIHSEVIALQDYPDFRIIPSKPQAGAYQPISADVSICEDCLRELFDPEDRRYRYPFINCTNCGPRFTIIQDIPYDRPNTTMSGFTLCEDCLTEYQDPMDRRFHAQPVACPLCGPHVELKIFNTRTGQFGIISKQEKALQQTRRLIQDGKVVAIKGLGGYHLACDATSTDAVDRLRTRKGRQDKPLAIMANDIESISKFCVLTSEVENLLKSKVRPIVLLDKIPGSIIAENVAPAQHKLGVMLPYTPLHYLLLEQSDHFPIALVMTSGNISEEPIAFHNEVAFEKLSHIADAFLTHNREIHVRCDDSVVRMVDIEDGATQITSHPYPIRRSRGYAPTPVLMNSNFRQILAAGPELKNTFCLTKENNAFISHHIGDMENYETLKAYESGIEHYERLFRIQPEIIAYDLHPNYLASIYARERAKREKIPCIGVQHHHAHIASCMADNDLPEDQQVIGVSFDGTGYGTDGKIWGGEIMLASYADFSRIFHLQYLPLPGGDKAIREPWRIALAYLDHFGFEWADPLPPVQYLRQSTNDYAKYFNGIRHQVESGINTVMNSSAGRLFDAVSALLGVTFEVNYEAQAAIELENIGDHHIQDAYTIGFEPEMDHTSQEISLRPLLLEILNDLKTGQSSSIISAKFHNTIVALVVDCCIAMRKFSGIDTVALSGGVWQNMTLLGKTHKSLEKNDFTVLIHERVPANDGGISLGQAVIANQNKDRI